MGLFARLRERDKLSEQVQNYFKAFAAYSPCFTSFDGGVYEMELTRAAIHSFANHVAKLKPEINGSGNERLERRLQYKPNEVMDTKKYLYRLATGYMTDNTVLIAPLYDDKMRIYGYYPMLSSKCQFVDYDGTRYIRYDFGDGRYGAIEFDRCGIMTQYQYHSELIGEDNRCLTPTMDLIATNNQGIIEGVKSSASIRFLAKLAKQLKPKDIEAERREFTTNNLSSSNNGGVLMYDTKYEDVKPIESKPLIINSAQMAQIKDNVYTYFGTNEHILKNQYTSDEWNAYYEGKIEPFALEASLVHTNMTFNEHEVAFGNSIIFTANRLQYLSNAEKLSTVTQLFDRGFITTNQGLEIFNMSTIEGGDKRYIRKEYALTDSYTQEGGISNADSTGQTVQGNADNAVGCTGPVDTE